ncbi:MAG: hypothetical protein R3C62_21350 [Chloroflexota bacterium]
MNFSERFGWWLAAVVGLLAVVGLVWGKTAVFSPILATDINQHRLNIALPTPRNDIAVSQSFVPRWNGLREVEVTLVRYGEKVAGENGRFSLQLRDDNNETIAEQTFPTSQLDHNQTLTLPVPLQPQSAGRRYTLRLLGNDSNTLSAWGYTLDVYNEGELKMEGGVLQTAVPTTNARELRFTTRYQLTLPDALRYLATTIFYEGALFLLALLFIPLPGLLLLQLVPRWRNMDAGAMWGTAVALGLSVWPLLWYWLTLTGGRWAGWSLWLVFVVGWGVVVWNGWRRREAGEQGSRGAGVLLLLVILAVAVRLLAVRDVTFAPWVDASRHGLITAVMTANGQTPTTYAPYLPVEQFPYHFGFHTIASSLQLMTHWPLARLLLYLGQLLNGLMPLMLYTAVWLLTRQRGAGLFAAFLVAFPFFFPAYYATWGRFTQLTAMLIMPVLLATTWLLLHRRQWAWRHHAWWLVGLLAAGLFLMHFRVFIFYLPFVLVAVFANLGRQHWWRGVAALAAAGGLALLLVGVRLWQLWRMANPASQFDIQIPGYNSFPTSYITVGWEQYYLWATAVLLLLIIITALLSRRQRTWALLPLTLAAWVALLFVLLSGEKLGLPETAVVNTNSMYITLFVPLALFLTLPLARFWRWWRRHHWGLQLAGQLWLALLIAPLLLFGVRQQITILNPQTILGQPDDLAAIAWVNDNLPPDARLAVSSWRWLGSTWAASDGGAWLLPITGRLTSTPPIDYIYNVSLFESIIAFNETAVSITDWHNPERADWLAQQGYTHIFVGARGGFFDPATLVQNPRLTLVYHHNGVFIFALSPSSLSEKSE